MTFEKLPRPRCEVRNVYSYDSSQPTDQCQFSASYRMVDTGRLVCTRHKQMLEHREVAVQFIDTNNVKHLCHRYDTCMGGKFCNVIPVWYETADGELIAPTLESMREKIERCRKGSSTPIMRCTLTLPMDCTYTREKVNE